MKRITGAWIGVAVVAAVVGLVLGGAVSAAAADPETFACVADDKLEKDIAAGAELTEFACFMDRYEGLDVLHVKVGVKNATDKDQRFRVNIFFDNGKAVGGLIPRTTKKGLVKPGEAQSFVYPVTGMTEKPGSIMLKISAQSN